MIKSVIFDIDNTLYSYDDAHAVAFPKVKAYAEQELGISASAFEQLHREVFEETKKSMYNTAAMHNRMIRYEIILERLGLPFQPHALAMYHLYWDSLLEAAAPSHGILPALKALKAKGIRIGVGSDMTAYIQFRKLEKLQLLSYIDFVVTSEEVGAEKPSKELFALVHRKAGCAPEECLFIGDSYAKDYVGAASYGMHPLLYLPDTDAAKVQEAAQNHGISSDTILTDMANLPDYITAL